MQHRSYVRHNDKKPLQINDLVLYCIQVDKDLKVNLVVKKFNFELLFLLHSHFYKEIYMTNIASPVTPVTTVSKDSIAHTAKIEQFVSDYRMCVQKTATAILELANVVNSAYSSLSKSDFKAFRDAIGADESKDSYIKKLKCIAQKSARFNAISDKLPPSYTTLYTLSQLNDATFTQLCSDNVIAPNMTALALTSYVDKKSTKNVTDIVLSLKNLSKEVKYLAFAEIQTVCKKFNIELKSNIQTPFANKIEKLADLNAFLIEDVEVKSELETA